MVAKTVRYLEQQGYDLTKITILVPYIGQLCEVRDALQRRNNPVMNDMDLYDLIQAGLPPASTPPSPKNPEKQIQVATIGIVSAPVFFYMRHINLPHLDNFQGEESDIVIVSLRRSNSDHDIGLLSSPERLNALISKARDALIIIGNAETFRNSPKGGEMWGKLIGLLEAQGHIYEGLPVRCEQHKDFTASLSKPEDFHTKCPEGGCTEPWYVFFLFQSPPQIIHYLLARRR